MTRGVRPELKACPFCGRAAQLVEQRLVVNGKAAIPVWRVRCGSCVVSTPTSANEKTVIRQWNRRAAQKAN